MVIEVVALLYAAAKGGANTAFVRSITKRMYFVFFSELRAVNCRVCLTGIRGPRDDLLSNLDIAQKAALARVGYSG